MDAQEEERFRDFVNRRWTPLVRYAYLLTGDRAAAEDVVQVALERTWRRWSSVRTDRPEAYVRIAITNTVISRHRWRVRRVAETAWDDDWAEGLRSSPPGTITGDGADGRAVQQVIWQEVQRLPPRMRAVVVLRLWEDLPEAEVAHTLGCTTGSVKSQLSRAMERLRARDELRTLVGRPQSALPTTPLAVSVPEGDFR